jgi:hypothetical protein
MSELQPKVGTVGDKVALGLWRELLSSDGGDPRLKEVARTIMGPRLARDLGVALISLAHSLENPHEVSSDSGPGDQRSS